MRCPVCGFDNLEGEDSCERCGASLWTVDTPEQAEDFTGRILGEHLDALLDGSPLTVPSDVSIDEAVGRMRAAGKDCLLIVDGDRLTGVFTERDAVLKLAGVTEAAGRSVGELMTRDPVVLRPDDTLAIAVHKMAVGGFRHIPLVDDGRPLGVVGAKDVFRHVLSLAD